MNSKNLVSIIVPAYNEEKSIKKVIDECKKLKKLFPLEIVVVQGGSKDKTIEVAKKSKVDKIISFPHKRGKGSDFWAGIVASNGEYVIQIDADNQFQAYEIPLFVSALKKGADVVIGTRFEGGKIEKGSITKRNFFGNWVMSKAVTLATGWEITDVMAGFKGFRRDAIMAIDLKEPHFEYEAESVVKAKRLNLKLVQIPITYKKRLGGVSGIRALRDGINVIKTIIKYRFFYEPPTKKHSSDV